MGDVLAAPEERVFAGVVGQRNAIAQLRASTARPVHAYLFVGPDASGASAAASGFAAALLCPVGGCGECDTCARVLAGVHPDFIVVERTGARLLVDDAREISRLALRTPTESARKVLVLTDFHLVQEAAPALLKTIEEPPASAVFLILADQVTPDLVTIASRCVRVDFPPLDDATIADALRKDGIPAPRAAELAADACGSLARARQLAADPDASQRVGAWRAVPDRLDGSAGAAVQLAADLVALLDAAAQPVIAQQRIEAAQLAERAKAGLPVPPKRELDARQRREQRRARTDELVAGLAVLASTYRSRLGDTGEGGGEVRAGRRALAALDAIADVHERLLYNPSELPLLEGLFARLSR
jgi:DNA polymerase-3 subunit delta'